MHDLSPFLFLIMYSNFKIMYAMVVMMWQCCVTIITLKNVDYCCIIYDNKSEAINSLKNSVFEDRG